MGDGGQARMIGGEGSRNMGSGKRGRGENCGKVTIRSLVSSEIHEVGD